MGSGTVTRGQEREEILALLRLRDHQGCGNRRIKAELERHGSAVGALAAKPRQEELWPRTKVEDDLAAWREEGFDVVPMTSPRYPSSLWHLVDPPPLIFLRGRRELLSSPAVAVVGSRKATEVGRRTAERLGAALARAGIAVVSGLALGIDAAAHRGALGVGEEGGKTIAVLGTGLRVVYPRVHRSLFRRIGEEGLLVTEFLPGEEARPHHFPQRNRIIAALAEAVVVVEAGERSGALITVDHALDLGREILAVPGSVENPRAAGSNALLADGASVVTSSEALLEGLDRLVSRATRAKGGTDSAEGLEPTLAVPEDLLPFWRVIPSDPVGVDEVAREAGVSSGEALAGLSALELGGWIVQCPGMRFQRA